MKSDFITIFCKESFKYSYNIFSIIRKRKYSQIILNLERHSMWFKPFVAFFWRKFSYSFSDKIPTTSIFCSKNFFVFDSCRQITSSSSGKDHLSSWRCILFEKMYTIFSLCIFKYCSSSHESCSTRSDDNNIIHTKSIYIFLLSKTSITEESLFLSQKFHIIVL